MACRVRDSLADDADQVLARALRELDVVAHSQLQLETGTRCDLLGDFGYEHPERLVERARERGDRTPGLAERPLGRAADERQARHSVLPRSETARLRRDECELLGKAVVEVARHPPAFLEHASVRDRPPIAAYLTRRPTQQQEVEAEPQRVAGIDPVRVERREER